MIVEREQDLAVLAKAVSSARQGRGQIALIAGEAGLGKTSLVSQLRRQSGGSISWLWGGCDALFTPRPLGPVLDIAADLGVDLDPTLEGGARAAVFANIVQKLETLSATTVIVVEDVHWADHATMDFLKFMGRRITFLKVLLMVTYRNDEVADNARLTQVLGEFPSGVTRRITLRPLSRDAVTRLADAAGQSGEGLFEITDGNPFFVAESLVARSLGKQHVPNSIQDAVGARLSRLSDEVRGFMQLMSAIPWPVPPEFAETLVEGGGSAVFEAVERGILVPDEAGDLRFRHELARLAVLERLSAPRRRSAHETILAKLIDHYASPPLDQLVHHAAGALRTETVLQYAPLAAEQAARVGAHKEAAEHLGTALRFVDSASPEEAAHLYERWAYEAAVTDRIDNEVIDARRHAITLWRALGRKEKVGENLRWLSRLHWYRGEAAESARIADQAVETLASAPPSSERAMAYSLRSQLHMLNDEMDQAVAWGHQALEMESQFPDPEVRVHALNNMGTAMVFRGNEAGLDLLLDSLNIALRHDLHEHVARVYTNLAEYAVEFRRFDLAEDVLTEGLAFDTEHDLDTWTHYLSGRLAQLRLEQGRLNDAVQISQGILSLDHLTLLMRLPSLQMLARSSMRLGKSHAGSLMDEALQDALATEELQHIVPARLTLVEGHWLNGNLVAARDQLDALMGLGEKDRHPWNLGERDVWARRLGGPDSQPCSVDYPKPIKLELGGDHAAAGQAWDELGMPYAASLARLASADHALMSTAFSDLHDMQAEGALRCASRLVDQAGLKVTRPSRKRGPYKAARTHPLGLTQREQDVLALLADGFSNKEISDRMSRSTRTVEHHVSSVLGKLGVSNRMAAMLRVRSEPWLISAHGPAEPARTRSR
ncbi:MAG: AAA family ATPase [Pseudomonadota bacterium]